MIGAFVSLRNSPRKARGRSDYIVPARIIQLLAESATIAHKESNQPGLPPGGPKVVSNLTLPLRLRLVFSNKWRMMIFPF